MYRKRYDMTLTFFKKLMITLRLGWRLIVQVEFCTNPRSIGVHYFSLLFGACGRTETRLSLKILFLIPNFIRLVFIRQGNTIIVWVKPSSQLGKLPSKFGGINQLMGGLNLTLIGHFLEILVRQRVEASSEIAMGSGLKGIQGQ